jgi:hypothetical protein
MMDAAALRRAIQERLTVPKYQAGRMLGWGRRVTDAAVRDGKMPVIDGGMKQTVPTAWIRRQLQIESEAQ